MKNVYDMTKEEFEAICTCTDCVSNHECEFAFDYYNTDGDCLAIK